MDPFQTDTLNYQAALFEANVIIDIEINFN